MKMRANDAFSFHPLGCGLLSFSEYIIEIPRCLIILSLKHSGSCHGGDCEPMGTFHGGDGGGERIVFFRFVSFCLFRFFRA